MNNFDKLKNRLAGTALSRFGEPVHLNGIEFNAIYEEQEIEQETGFTYIKTLSFLREDIINIVQVNDKIIYQNEEYIVDRVLNKDNYYPLVLLEIKRA